MLAPDLLYPLSSNSTGGPENERKHQRSHPRDDHQHQRNRGSNRRNPARAEQPAQRTARHRVRSDHARIHRQLARRAGLTPKRSNGRIKMNASTTTERLAGIGSVEQTEVSEGTRLAQYSMLNEIPGAIFGIITVAYIVGALLSLAH